MFDIAYTSVLKRAIRTCWIALDELDLLWIPMERDWRLNERHYGALQGLNKAETAAKHGDAQTKIWRRSYDIPPPPLDPTTRGIRRTIRATPSLSPDELPATESLKDTVARFVPYWNGDDRAGDPRRPARADHGARQQPARAREVSRRDLRRGHRRAEHPDGHSAGLRARRRSVADPHFYLGDPEAARKAAEAVAKQADSQAAEAESTAKCRTVYSTSFSVGSSAEIRSDLRKRRSLALISND